MGNTKEFLQGELQAGNLDFALEAPAAKIKRRQPGGGVRPSEPPKEKIKRLRLIADGDPHAKEGVNTLVDYLVGSGGRIRPRNIPYTDQTQSQQDIADLKKLIYSSSFTEVELPEWVWHGLVDGTAFLEIVWENNEFKPRVLPPSLISIIPDEFGNIAGYEMQLPGGKKKTFGKYDIAILRFHKHPGEEWGHSILEAGEEQADMLRDMEIDQARYIATKAYPPIQWKMGSAERRYSDAQIDKFLDEAVMIEPDSMLGTQYDVEAQVVGAATGAQSAAMSLETTFSHLEDRIAAGMGTPSFLINMASDAAQNGQLATMPKFDRRIKRYQAIIREAIEGQIFRSILGHPNPEDFIDIVPEWEFGEHSSDEERLDTNEQISLFMMGMLTREAFAERVGIDPEVEMPSLDDLEADIIPIIQQLKGSGDAIQNPDGGSPTDTGTGVNTPGQEVKTRQNPERQTDDSRPKRSVSNE